MKSIYQRNLHTPYIMNKPNVVAMGSFDGLHLGHQKLVSEVVRLANELNLNSLIYTYENHPSTILNYSGHSRLITSNKLRAELFKALEVDYLYFDEFSNKYANMSPEKFVDEIIVKKLNARVVVVGFDYRFGKNGNGNVDILMQLCSERGIDAVCVDPVYYDGEKVSSTRIRKALKQGNLKDVANMLGRHFSIEGTVEYGKQLGGKMGFPTANIYPYEMQALPHSGVYVTNVYLCDKVYRGVTNVGFNPTVDDDRVLKVETFIIDFDDDLYGQNIKVEFVEMIRGEIKFEGLEQLFAQIDSDVSFAKNYKEM